MLGPIEHGRGKSFPHAPGQGDHSWNTIRRAMAAFNIIEMLRGMRDWIPFPKKKCPNCGTEVSRFASVCPNCGYEFGPVLG
jgi:hypothetical protein